MAARRTRGRAVDGSGGKGTARRSRGRRQRPARNGSDKRRIRYAVVGQGYIAQAAVLPAFAHARENSELAALVSDDREKLEKLGRKYRVDALYTYDEYGDMLESRAVDAVYIALPNHLHRDYTVRAARAGVHVLCEKPMGVTERDCEAMIEACDRSGVKLMIAYRLHFESANLEAIEIVRAGEIGEARLFSSVFSMQVEDEDNIRLSPAEQGGGPLYDIGIYCINAARSLFRDEPLELFAESASRDERRFRNVDEMTSAVLRFPDDRLAAFTCSFGGADVSTYQVVGTSGHLRLDPAFEYAEPLRRRLTVNGKARERTFSKREQFAPELVYFSGCILRGLDPEPAGREGLADIRIIRGLLRSAASGKPVTLEPFERRRRPEPGQAMRKPPVRKPRLVNVEPPSGGS